MDYWEECIKTAFEDAGIVASEAQIAEVVDTVKGSHENYGMYHGYDVIPCPVETQLNREAGELRAKIKAQEDWLNSTEPCKSCTTSGVVLDGWGRPVECDSCGGKGRV